MKLFDSILTSLTPTLLEAKALELPSAFWPDSDPNELLFKIDTAYELGGGSLPAYSGCFLTSDPSLVRKDSVYLLGKDLNQIQTDVPYARIAIVRVKDEEMGQGNELYQAIRRLDYTRYHVSPKGFMLRISSMNSRESVRVGKKALKEGMDFASIGRSFIKAYHQQKAVEAVKLIFITDPTYPFSKLEEAIQRNEDVTKALDHLLNKVSMDCHSCSLQKVCAEVETMVEKDFNKESSR